MKKLNAAVALILSVLLIFSLAGCAKEQTEPQKETSVTAKPEEIIATTQEDTKKTGIDLYFEKCAALAEEAGKPMRTSRDVWSEEEVSDDWVKYTSLGSSVTNTILYDREKDQVLSVSSSVDIESYTDEETRAAMVFNVSTLTAAMAGGERDMLDRFSSCFESVIESGIEMYQDNMRFYLSADETAVTMTAEISK